MVGHFIILLAVRADLVCPHACADLLPAPRLTLQLVLDSRPLRIESERARLRQAVHDAVYLAVIVPTLLGINDIADQQPS
jgi:hypothetical protein